MSTSTPRLTAENQQKLDHYRQITNQPVDLAIPKLEASSWNVTTAVTDFFEHGSEVRQPAARPADGGSSGIDPGTTPGAAPPNRRGGPRHRRQPARLADRAGVAAPATPSEKTSVTVRPPFVVSFLLVPFSVAFGLAGRFFRMIGFFFPIFPRTIARLTSGTVFGPVFGSPAGPAGSTSAAATAATRTTFGSRKQLGGQDTADRAVREFCEIGGVDVAGIEFYRGTYSAAYDNARRSLKLLVPVLVSFEHDDASPFIRQSVLSDDFLALVAAGQASEDVVVWLGDVCDPEAFQVANSFGVTRFPFVGLLAPVKSRNDDGRGMRLLAKTQGLVSGPVLRDRMTGQMTAARLALGEQRRRNGELEAARELRQRQDDEYRRSLLEDRQQDEKAAEAAARQAEQAALEAEQARIEQEEAEQEARLADLRLEWCRWKAGQLRARGLDRTDGPDGTVQMKLQLPDGSSQVIEYSARLAIQDLYSAIECFVLAGAQVESQGELDECPAGYAHAFRFRLVVHVPRQTLDPEDERGIVDILGRRARLMVEDVEEWEPEVGNPDEKMEPTSRSTHVSVGM